MPTQQGSTAPVSQAEEVPHGARIKVVGVGGGGSNAIDRMIDFGVEGVEFIALNTDLQALQASKAQIRGQIGSRLTNGLGAGSNPDVGRRAAIEDAGRIAEALEGADMVFITAGLGGGTGTGAAPVIAAIASELGALTVAIVTRPFGFEGKRRMAIADWGIHHLLNYVDTLIVIPNEKLLAIAKDAPFFESFRVADDYLRQTVQGISDIITTAGVINRDFADVKTTMAGMGYAVMGTASRSGPNRAVDAVTAAMESPLLEAGAIDGARGILINITGSSSLRLSEVNDASTVIQSVAHEDANILFGAVLDERLGDEVKVTVIATGFHDESRGRSRRRAALLKASAKEIAADSAGPDAAEQVTAHAGEQMLHEEETVAPPEEHAVQVKELTVDSHQKAAVAEVMPGQEEIEPAGDVQEPLHEQQSVQHEGWQSSGAPFVDEHQQTIGADVPHNDIPDLQDISNLDDGAHSEDVSHADARLDDSAPVEQNQRTLDGAAPDEDIHLEAFEEEDWRDAIREIALLAEPAVESAGGFDTRLEGAIRSHTAASAGTTDEEDRNASRWQDDLVADEVSSPFRKLAELEVLQQAVPLYSPIRAEHKSGLSFQQAAIAAYAAASTLEDEAEPIEKSTAFAAVLAARRNFIDNLPLRELTAGATAAETFSGTSQTAKRDRDFDQADSFIDSEADAANGVSEEERVEHTEDDFFKMPEADSVTSLPGSTATLSETLLILESGRSESDASGSTSAASTERGDPDETVAPGQTVAPAQTDDLVPTVAASQPVALKQAAAFGMSPSRLIETAAPPEPLPEFNRRLHRDPGAPANWANVEATEEPLARVPSFASVADDERYNDEFDELEIPAFLRRGN